MKPGCEARRVGDEMHCGRCGLAWATDDLDPPVCAPKVDLRAILSRRISDDTKRLANSLTVTSAAEIDRLASMPTTRKANPVSLAARDAARPRAVPTDVLMSLPLDLPPDVLRKMIEAHEAYVRAHGRMAGRQGAMQAVYRVLLRNLPR